MENNKLNKLEAIELFLSKVEYDTGVALSCIREIVEDTKGDLIDVDEVEKLINFANEY